MNKKKKKKIKNINRKNKTLQVQNIIKTFTQFINIPQLNNDNIDYNVINDTKGHNTVISTKYNIIQNGFEYKTDSLTCGNKLSDLLNKTYIVRIFPNQNQKKILLSWMNDYINMYNKVLNKIKLIRKEYNIKNNKVFKYNEVPFNLTLNQLKKEFSNYKDELNSKTQINKHILDYAIQDALNALESVKTNLDKGNIKNSRLRYLKKSKNNKIIKIEKQICQENSFCSSILSKILKAKPTLNYKRAVEQIAILKYDSKTDKFYFHLKYKIDKNKNRSTDKIGCFDIGLRTFFTGISNDYTIEYGYQINKHIKKILDKIDKIKSKKMVKNKLEYMVKNGISKHKLIKNKRKHLLKYEKYLSNYINNIHWQIVDDMTKRFDYIVLGNFSTKNMVESDSTSKINKRIGNALKLYQFKQKLKYKCLIKGCKYKVIDEYMTTQCCSNCSKVNPNIKDKKIFECMNCKHEYDRDINSAKNIFMKSLNYNLTN